MGDLLTLRSGTLYMTARTMCEHSHIKMYTSIDMFTYTYISMYLYMYIYIYVHSCGWCHCATDYAQTVCIVIYKYIHVYVRIHKHIYLYLYTYTYICIYIRAGNAIALRIHSGWWHRATRWRVVCWNNSINSSQLYQLVAIVSTRRN